MSSNYPSDDALEQEIILRLQKLKPSLLELYDESYQHIGHAGAKEHGGRHYKLIIRSDCFQGISLIKRHQMIYALLENLLKKKIHALKINAKP